MTAQSWEDLKKAGNELFGAGEYLKAAAKYSAAIKTFSGEDSELAILHSNRCVALLKISKFGKALADADKCIALRPDWEKGYFRKGTTLEAISDYTSALDVYREGAKRAPDNKELGLKAARMEARVRKLKIQQKADGA